MTSKAFPQDETRAALTSSLPQNDQSDSEPRAPQLTFVPPSHARALNPDSTIVEGMRGAGKSHWWAALNSEQHRRYLAEVFPEARIEDNLQSSQGFGTRVPPQLAPGKNVLAKLIKKNNARHIWQAVVAVHAKFQPPFPQDLGQWERKVEWIRENPEDFDVLLYKADDLLTGQGRKHLILFDAAESNGRRLDRHPTVGPRVISVSAGLDLSAKFANKAFRSTRYVAGQGNSSFP